MSEWAAVVTAADTDPFQPSDISHLGAWYRSYELRTLSNNSTVQTWWDHSGNGNHAVQDTESLRPIIVNNVLNGYSILRFDNANSQTLRAPNSSSISLNSSCTVIMVNSQGANSTGAVLDMSDAVTGTENYGMLDVGGATAILMQWLNGSYWQYSVIELSMQTYGVRCYRYNGSTFDAWENKVSKASDISINQIIASTADVLNIAKYNVASQGYYNGDIAEILIYKRALTTGECDKLADYFNRKFNLF